MSPERTNQIMRRYWDSGITDTRLMAEDVVFTMMADGSTTRGREAVMHMLKHLYRVAFDARLEIINEVIGAGRAVSEGYFAGTHIGEFAGIPATGYEVRVPLCVSYELEGDLIRQARVYLEMPLLWAQLGAASRQAANQRLTDQQDV